MKYRARISRTSSRMRRKSSPTNTFTFTTSAGVAPEASSTFARFAKASSTCSRVPCGIDPSGRMPMMPLTNTRSPPETRMAWLNSAVGG